MVEWKVTKITCADDIYEETRAIEKHFLTYHSMCRNKKPKDYIWDEDKTIRENKELTAQYNAEIDAEIERCQQAYNLMLALLDKHIYEYIIDSCNVKCSEKQAEVIWNYCKTQHEDDPHNYIDDVIELFEKLMEQGYFWQRS